jgi:pimeloyl-ACP methyl ester carboxylesterase
LKNIYCISGLGADEKIFAHVKLEGYTLIHISWLTPEKNEELSSYAARMSALIKEDNPLLLGVSFGGMICLEIAKQRPVRKLILISSVKGRNEIPLWMRVAGKLKLNKFVPLRSNRLTEPLQNRNLGVEMEEERKLARYYRKNINRKYLVWAINVILNWQSSECKVPVYHIHGERDRIFPIKNIKADFVVPAGGHLMIMNRSVFINKELNRVLKESDC